MLFHSFFACSASQQHLAGTGVQLGTADGSSSTSFSTQQASPVDSSATQSLEAKQKINSTARSSSCERVRRNITFLLEHLDPRVVLADLVENSVITVDDYLLLDELAKGERGRKEAAGVLVKKLLQSSERMVDTFIECLQKHEEFGEIVQRMTTVPGARGERSLPAMAGSSQETASAQPSRKLPVTYCEWLHNQKTHILVGISWNSNKHRKFLHSMQIEIECT